ncbi:hypothetical protein ACFT4A_41900 [Streptomyces sp. NPDC057099]|uniref:hypothetical protein n=1 Tax=Streptomyces sp. NPDC057099 TaxID=3346019 RepID=UPI003645B52C
MALVLKDALVHPTSPNRSRARLRKTQSTQRILSRAEKEAELFFPGVLVDGRERIQVHEALLADIFNGMDVHLVRRPHCPDLDKPDTGPLT